MKNYFYFKRLTFAPCTLRRCTTPGRCSGSNGGPHAPVGRVVLDIRRWARLLSSPRLPPQLDFGDREATPPAPGTPVVLPVSLLVSSARLLLERHLGLAWVSGEISNFTRAASGHCYFNLKDAKAQVRCVFFRHKAQLTAFTLKDGVQVELRATPSIYEARGEFQLNVETIRLAGIGRLYERFAELKARLAAAGWFAEERKKPVPAHARAIGIVTSLRAAALHDVLTTLRRRWPAMPVIVYPAAVQGTGAAARDRDRHPDRQRPRRGRRPGRVPRRRLHRGSVAVQRGSRRARDLRIAPAGHLGRRPRDGLHDLRFRGRRARAHADRRRGARRARWRRD